MPKKKQPQHGGATESKHLPERDHERDPKNPDIPNPTVPNRAGTEMKKGGC